MGFVLFSAFDANNQLVIPRDGMAYYVLYTATMANNLRLALGLKDPSKDFTENRYQLPIKQIQLFYHGAQPPDEKMQKELEQIYTHFRVLIKFNRRKSKKK